MKSIYNETYYQTAREAPEYLYALLIVASGISNQPNYIVLDLGCGKGPLLKRLSGFSGRVVGVDVSGFALKQVKSHNLQNTELVQASAITLPFQDHSFNAIFSIEVIEHIEQSLTRSFLSEIYRVLKKGGRLVITTPNLYTWTWLPSILLLRKPLTLYSDLSHINLLTRRKLHHSLSCAGFEKILSHSREMYYVFRSTHNPLYRLLSCLIKGVSRQLIVAAEK